MIKGITISLTILLLVTLKLIGQEQLLKDQESPLMLKR